MFYKQFLKITDVLNSDFVEEFDFWLTTLPINRQKNITASLIAGKFDVSYSQADIILQFCKKEKILEEYYLIVCPNEECGMFIRDVSFDELSDVLGHQEYCHVCGQENIISPNDIYVAYKRILKPNVSDEEIQRKILEKIMDNGEETNFSKADFLGNNRNLYKVYYDPDESAYKKMAYMKEHLDDDFPTDIQIGEALEKLALYMFNGIKYVRGTDKLKTYTNQLDCTVKVPFKGQGYPVVFEYMSPYFIIECKNEKKKSPSNTYFHKISDIMDGNEAQLGIVISRKKAGKEALTVAREEYLLHKNTNKKRNLISFSDEDLKKLIDDKENLLEYLEWKIMNLTTNAKNSDFEMFKLRERDEN